nr:bifunctional epoxide hydrolase 2-like [Ipomoea batatas]
MCSNGTDSSTSSSKEETKSSTNHSDGENQSMSQNVSFTLEVDEDEMTPQQPLRRGKAPILNVVIPYYHVGFSFGSVREKFKYTATVNLYNNHIELYEVTAQAHAESGEIEGEFAAAGTRRVVERFLTYHSPNPPKLPKGKPIEAPTQSLPSWLSENDVDYYVSMFEKTGFTGGMNYYRALDLNWELSAAWTGAKVRVPVKFIVGDLDITYNSPGTKEYIHKGGLKKDVPLLEEVVVLEGVGHFVHEEKPHEINTYIYDFLQNFSSV